MSYDAEVLADSPVAYWKLQELVAPPPPPNTALTDSSGNGWNGALSPSAVLGIAGPILTDGTTYGMSGPVGRIPNTGNALPGLTPSGDFTWECWSKKSDSGIHLMMNRGRDPEPNSVLSWNEPNTGVWGDQVLFTLQWGTGTDPVFGLNSCRLADDTWYHVAGVRQANVMRLYIDGWLVADRDDCPADPFIPEASPWRLGYVAAFFGAIWESQALSHVAIYSSALSVTRLRAHVVAALGSLPANPCGVTPTITVGCPNAEGIVGEPYSSEIIVVGGTPPYTFSIVSGALPTGLSLNPSTGIVSGTPTVGGTFNFTVQVIDADANIGTSPGCQVVITAAPPPPPPSPTRTVTFDSSGLGNTWYLALLPSDSGDELRSKVLKPMRITGKVSNCTAKVYSYSPTDEIDVGKVEDGTGFTAEISFPTTTQVQQSALHSINVPNACTHLVRVEGTWDGNGLRDRIDEIMYQQGEQGVRR
jgi:hypothetical protein